MTQKPVFNQKYKDHSLTVLNEALQTLVPYSSWKDPALDHVEDIDLRYQNLPYLTKKELREFGWQNFISLKKDYEKALLQGEISLVETSGTTEDKVTNVWNQEWWNWTEQYSWGYNSIFNHMEYGKSPEAILTSPHNTGFLSNDLNLAYGQRKLERFLYLNEKSNPSYWNESLMERMRLEINEFQPAVLEVNPSYLGILSHYLKNTGKKIHQPHVIVFSFENYSGISKKLIRSVFQSPIASSFGSTEAGCVLMECEKGFYHQNIESCRIDFQPFHSAFGPQHTGRILVTPFNNPWRIMVRFDIGDIVRMAPSQECPCGRQGGYLFERIEGRVSGLTFNNQGKCVTPRELDDEMSLIQNILNYQLIQKDKNQYLLQLELSDTSAFQKIQKEAVERLRHLYGKDSQIDTKEVPFIQTESSGKYRHSKCEFPFSPNNLFSTGILE